MFSHTVIHGMSEKFWNTTMRSSPGPAISLPSRTMPPALALSSPAMMLSSVDLPQPECPTIVTNSPFSMRKCTSLKTQRSPAPSEPEKYFVTWSISRKDILLRVGELLRQPAESQVEQDADRADSQNREDD